MEIETIGTASLGDRSYLVHDGEVALVVDPQRDLDRVEEVAGRLGVRITHVAETHVHNDYVTGGLALARRHDARYLVAAAEEVAYERHPVRPGDALSVGALALTAVATPGHTPHHLAYVVAADGRQAVFSGGSLLFGSVGRTDLVSPDRTRDLTHAQYHSARALAAGVLESATLHPTHGFGSFCSSGPASGAQASTIGEQLRTNHALTDPDEQRFVATLMAGLTAYPSYYSHMAPLNRLGPTAADVTVPAPLSAAEVSARLDAGQWVVDLRNRVAFAGGHVRGAVSFEYGTSFATYLGWVVPWGEPVTLLGSEQDVSAAIRDLSRIGIDRPSASFDPALGEQVSYPIRGWDALSSATSPVVLDVRRPDEFATRHITGAINIPLHELMGRLDEVPAGTVWVHCASGYRAGVAASLLHRAGREVVHLNADWSQVHGVPTT